MRNNRTRDITFMAFYVALALVLDYASELIPFFKMPNGGSINVAVIAVFIASYHLGWKNGALTGLLWWLVGFMFGQNAWYLNPAQYAFDYIIPMVICGMCAMFPRVGKVSNIFTGVTMAMVIRYFCQVISGAYFWMADGVAAGSWPAWAYGLSYNFGFNFVTLLVALVVTPVLINRLSALRNVKFVGLK